MSALPDADQTRLTAVPTPPPESDGDRMNGFEVAVNFFLNWLPTVASIAVIGLSAAAGAIEMFMEIGPYWSVLVTAGLIGSGIYGGTRLRLLPVVPEKRDPRG